MSALYTITAAIVKLTELKASAPGGPWRVGESYMDYPTLDGSDDHGREFGNQFASIDNIPAGRLIVTLHNTIDAQLAILRAAQDDYNQYGGKPSQFFANDINLARAILGEDH